MMKPGKQPSAARTFAAVAAFLALALPVAPSGAQSGGTVEEGIAPPFKGEGTSCHNIACVATADAETGRLELIIANVPGGIPTFWGAYGAARVSTTHHLQEPAHRVTYEVDLDLQGAGLAVGSSSMSVRWEARALDCGTFTSNCWATSVAGFAPHSGPITLETTLQPSREPPALRPGPVGLFVVLTASATACGFPCWSTPNVLAAAATVTVLDVRARIEPWTPSDLGVQALDLDPKKGRSGEPVNVTAHVANLGPDVSASTTLAWRHAHDGATDEAEAPVPALGPGETATFAWSIVAARGENTVTATIDAAMQTQDLDRSNNEVAITFWPRGGNPGN